MSTHRQTILSFFQKIKIKQYFFSFEGKNKTILSRFSFLLERYFCLIFGCIYQKAAFTWILYMLDIVLYFFNLSHGPIG